MPVDLPPRVDGLLNVAVAQTHRKAAKPHYEDFLPLPQAAHISTSSIE
jgi:hypothetical protein